MRGYSVAFFFLELTQSFSVAGVENRPFLHIQAASDHVAGRVGFVSLLRSFFAGTGAKQRAFEGLVRPGMDLAGPAGRRGPAGEIPLEFDVFPDWLFGKSHANDAVSAERGQGSAAVPVTMTRGASGLQVSQRVCTHETCPLSNVRRACTSTSK